MDSDLIIRNNGKPRTCRGFALVVALSLMAFMLVLVVTLLSLMEVETRSAGNSLEIQKAREGARLALNMAIGQLQEHAGHDQRVTARADIAGVAANREDHWTGVWDTDVIPNPADTTFPPFVAWLVSGINPEPANPLDDGNSLELVGPESTNDDGVIDTNDYVRAPFINILDANGSVVSRIAWWTGDEGIKASVGEVPLTPASGRPNPNYISNTPLNSLQTMFPASQGIEAIFTDYDRFNNAGNASDLDRITMLGQLPVFADFADNSNWDLTNGALTEDLFHTVTPLSLGLLTSTGRDIGLMQDLSLFPELVNDQFADVIDDAASRSIANATNSANSLAALQHTTSLRGIEALEGVPADGSISNPVTPVLTNFMLSFAIYETYDPSPAGTSSFYKVHFFCEFWNPYTSRLSMNDGTNDLNLELKISDLPVVVIESSGVTREINLQTLLAGSGPLIIKLPYDTSEPWYPGMTKNWVGIRASAGGNYESIQDVQDSTFRTKPWDDPSYTLGDVARLSTGVARVTDATNPTDDFLIRKTSDTTLSIDVFFNDETGTSEPKLLSKVQGVTFGPFDTDLIGLTPVSGLSNNDDSTFSFHFILKGPYQSNDDSNYRGVWLLQNDPRNLIGTSATRLYTPVENGISPNANPASTSKFNGSVIVSDSRRLWDRSNDASSGSILVTDYFAIWQDAPLFEIPRERILSLASLQHLYFHGERPFRVGNTWGRSENFPGSINTLKWFDQYYFSGLSRDDDPDGYVFGNGLPNPTLYPFGFTNPAIPTADSALNPSALISDWQTADKDDATRSKQLAELSLVKNRFNINSTSVAAWKAVLSGLRIDGWHYVDETSSDRSIITPLAEVFNNSDNRKSMFARFSHSLQETYKASQTPGDDLLFAATEYYRRGARYLTDTQVTALAESIVRQFKAKNSPFISMEEFLSHPDNGAGVLEQAITDALPPTNNRNQEWDRSWETTGVVGDGSDRIDIDHFSPGFLTQADIMTAIGPMLAPRSDTFKIRARCQTLSPFNSTEVIGDATIEAVVQRVPDPVNPADDDVNNSIQRRFKIMSVRWLTENEL